MIQKITLLFILFINISLLYATETNMHISNDGIEETYISSHSFRDKKVTYSIKDNLALFEGDIVLGTVDQAEKWKDMHENMQTKDAHQNAIIISGNRYRWENGIIPYHIASNVSSKTRKIIKNAIAHIEARTNVDFVKRTNNNAYIYPNYVEIISDYHACWSSVGKRGHGKQILNVVSACGFGGTVHELCHAVGLWHEQSRQDRNHFVKVNFENIREKDRHNFNQHISDGDDIGTYDYRSIMHYGKMAFSKNGRPTITPRKSNIKIGQRKGLSYKDISAINRIYGAKKGNSNAPTQLKVYSIKKHSIKFRFKDNSNNEQGFRLYLSSGHYLGRLSKKSGKNLVYGRLTHLRANKTYELYVVAYNRNGSISQRSNIYRFKTKRY